MDRLKAAIEAFRAVEPHAIINRAALLAAIDAERERCAKVAEGFVMTGPSPIGPLHGAGWSDAATRIAAAIRSQE